MIPSKYLVVVVQILTILATSFIAALADNQLTQVEVFQIAGIGVGAIGAYFVPLLVIAWAALGKFAVSVVGAILAAIPPIVDTANGGSGWTATAILIVVLAGLNAALTAWGVTVRVDEVKAALVDPTKSNAATIAVDPVAVQIATFDGR